MNRQHQLSMGSPEAIAQHGRDRLARLIPCIESAWLTGNHDELLACAKLGVVICLGMTGAKSGLHLPTPWRQVDDFGERETTPLMAVEAMRLVVLHDEALGRKGRSLRQGAKLLGAALQELVDAIEAGNV